VSNTTLDVLTVGITLAQLAALLWVLIRRGGMRPVLLINLLFAVGVLIFVVPNVPEEVSDIRFGMTSEFFDYKNVVLTLFEAVTLSSSALAFRGWLPAKIVAWLGFFGNFLLSLLAVLFALTFEFKCCGYL
jgi:hypothetical protein